MIICKQIKKCREKMGLTQGQLAEKCGVSRQAVNSWENGTYVPDITILIELSNIFNVSLDFLIKGEGLYEDKQRKMTKKAANIFAEVMSWIGDNWNEELVMDVYGDLVLEDALEKRIQENKNLQNFIREKIKDE